MKKRKLFFLLLLAVALISCKKRRDYHIQGLLQNEITGNSHNMGGEYIELLRISPNHSLNIFSNPDKSARVAQTITDKDGHFDFGINEIKAGDYQINYVQGEAKSFYGVTNSFVNINLGKGTEITETIAISPTLAGMKFYANPITTSSAQDTIFVEFVSETRKAQNPGFTNSGFATAAQINTAPFQPFAGIDNTEFMGNIFIKLTKSYHGIRSVERDTVFVGKDELYSFSTAF